MTETLNFLLSGPGLIGRQHAKLLRSRSDCSLVAIVAPARPEHEAFARDCGARFFTDVDEALRHGNVDAAIVSSPNASHHQQALACIASGVPVLIEKPVTAKLEDAGSLVKTAEQAKVPILVGHHRTHSPLLDAVQDFLRSPYFGQPVALRGSALFYKPAKYFRDGEWRTKTGGGPILINMIHEIGLMRYFFGEISSVSALASSSIRSFEVEDTVAVSLRFASGALGTFLLSDSAASTKSWEMTSGENPAYPHFPEEDCYHFAGTNGSLDFPSMNARYYKADIEPSWWNEFEAARLPLIRANPLERQLAHFVDVVLGRVSPRVSVRDGYLNMLVVDAIMRSIASGCIVSISDNQGSQF